MSDIQERPRTADRVRIFKGPDDRTPFADVCGDDVPAFPDHFNVTDLEKTYAEKAAAREAIAAVNDMLLAVTGGRGLRMALDQVHILDPKEFDDKIAKGRAQGKSWHGHVYVARGWPTWMLLGILAHECLHAASYLWIDMRTPDAPLVLGMRVPVLPRKAGMMLIDPDWGTLLPHFHGLDEMVTETAALVVRQLLAARTALLEPDDRERLKNLITSPPLVTFMDRLLNLAMGDDPDPVKVWKLVLGDYMNGRDGFLARLEPTLPGATERLRRTGSRPFELLSAASDLGLTDIADAIRPYVEE